jgi:hypothetical protein
VPGFVSFDEDEIYKINRLQLALELKKLPSEIDQISLEDFEQLLQLFQLMNERSSK